ncbi:MULTISPECIES: hypothetical protein [Actinomadura]|uniref:Uncharacterized protein n=1 Tax=Actinomadura litoris TaxID=2678616 RepID=A0A7K1KTM3_9ACTN|nr:MULTISPECIES: hypothetical protein [Actinomadura]MBT2207679.1 hypothetical protein [Actinomadura sp. NEAU-AAG7]MUN35522.1 hypothetical protein [Actinomadura litoris]
MHTYATALKLIGVTVPGHLTADAEVPILTGPQAQGDLLVIPTGAPRSKDWRTVPATGVRVVRGEATGNTHWLHPGFDSPGVSWLPASGQEDGLAVGHLRVPGGQTALLIHTDEHGANGIGPGEYVINRKRQAKVAFDAAPRTASGTSHDLFGLVDD